MIIRRSASSHSEQQNTRAPDEFSRGLRRLMAGPDQRDYLLRRIRLTRAVHMPRPLVEGKAACGLELKSSL